jgi:hypothetical protein
VRPDHALLLASASEAVDVLDAMVAELEQGIRDHRAKTARRESHSVREKKRAQVRVLLRLRTAIVERACARAEGA